MARAYGVSSGDAKAPSRWTFYIGQDGKVLAVDQQVNAATHGAEIAARLKELGVARRP